MSLRELLTACPEVTEHDKSLLPLLVEHARYALLAGVRLNLQEWVGLDFLERAAWVAAAQRLRVEDANRSALASAGPLGPALVEAEVDGGKALGDSVVLMAAEEVARG